MQIINIVVLRSVYSRECKIILLLPTTGNSISSLWVYGWTILSVVVLIIVREKVSEWCTPSVEDGQTTAASAFHLLNKKLSVEKYLN